MRELHEDVPRRALELELTQRVATTEERAEDLADVGRAGSVEIKSAVKRGSLSAKHTRLGTVLRR